MKNIIRLLIVLMCFVGAAQDETAPKYDLTRPNGKTTAQINAMTRMTEGSEAWNTDTNTMWRYVSSIWVDTGQAGAPETDPVYIADPAFGITAQDLIDFAAAYAWGDHATEGYLTDAPSNGSEYVRKDGAWAVVTGGGGGQDWSDPVDANILPDTPFTRNIGSFGNEFEGGWFDYLESASYVTGSSFQFSPTTEPGVADSEGTLYYNSTSNNVIIRDDSGFVELLKAGNYGAGGDMLGTLDMNSFDIVNIGNSTASSSRADEFLIESIVPADISWKLRANVSDGSMAIASETAAGSNSYLNRYTLATDGTPAAATDLIDKAYADANYDVSSRLPLDGSQPMEGAIDMAQHDILEGKVFEFNQAYYAMKGDIHPENDNDKWVVYATSDSTLNFQQNGATALSYRLRWSGVPTGDRDLIPKEYADANYVPFTGGTITGDMSYNSAHRLDGGQIQFLPDAVISTNSSRSEFGVDVNNYYYFNTSPSTNLFGRFNFTSLTASHSYAFPDASGTLALTSDLAGTYLALAGGTMTGPIIQSEVSTTGSQLYFENSTDNLLSLGVGNGSSISFNSLGQLYVALENKTPGVSYNDWQIATNNTATRTYTMPDASGTVALTTDLAGTYLPLTGGVLTGAIDAPAFYGDNIRVESQVAADRSWNFIANQTDGSLNFQAEDGVGSNNYPIAYRLRYGGTPTADEDIATKKYVDDNVGGGGGIAGTIPGRTGSGISSMQIETPAEIAGNPAIAADEVVLCPECTPAEIVTGTSITLDGEMMLDDQAVDSGTFTFSSAGAGDEITIYIDRASAPNFAGTNLVFNPMPGGDGFKANTQQLIYLKVTGDTSQSPDTVIDVLYIDRE